jgi:Polyketide cyclase / dehydrase and lipid transport
MTTFHVEATALIHATPDRVYNVFADYRNEHPNILPKPYFTSLTVEKGGYGAGTVMLVKMHVLGQDQTLRLIATEPEPGRVLREADESESVVVTTFTVDPADGGSHARVTIASDFVRPRGLAGWLMPLLAAPVFRTIYEKELAQVEAYLTTKLAAAPAR